MEQVGVISLALTIKVLDEIRAILKDSAERFDSWEPTASDQESLSSTERDMISVFLVPEVA